MKYLFAICYLLWTTLASAQQSERFDEFELHYSIVYSTFLTADIAAHGGIDVRVRRVWIIGKQCRGRHQLS